MTKTEKGSRKAAFSFLEANTGAPLPGLAASAANRIPRWLLILIVLLYIGHGLFYRDPWRGDDMLGLALARTTAEGLLRGDFSLLLLPQLGDLAWNQQGPLWTALLAIFMLPAYLWAASAASPVPIHLLDDLARIPVALAMALGLVAVWKATDRFARRREAQPVDPLGLGPRASAFGKTLGDCALLLTIASIGVVEPWHQLGTAAVAFPLQGLLLWALATAPESPKRAGYQAAIIMFASLLMHGVGLALAQLLTVVLVLAFVRQYQFAAGPLLARWAALMIPLLMIWLICAAMVLGSGRLLQWWQGGFYGSSLSRWMAGEVPVFHNVEPWIRELLWRWWPVWPIALYGIIKVGALRILRSPHWAVPVMLTIATVVLGLLGPAHWRVHQFAPVIPLALVAAFSLLSLPRSIVNLVDWLAVVLFTTAGIFVWIHWTALNFGIPAELSTRIARVAPGLPGNANGYEIMIGLFATLAWIALVIWRVGRGKPRIWRPVALSTGGVALLWILLTTLWRPAIDRLQGQQVTASAIEQAWRQAAQQRLGIPEERLRKSMGSPKASDLPREACVELSRGSVSTDAMLVAITRLPIANHGACLWRVVPADLSDPAVDPTRGGWRAIWQSSGEDGRRRTTYVLYERIR